MTKKSLSLSEARANLSEAVNTVAFGQSRIELIRHGKAVAAIVSIEDANLLEALEDKIDLDEARKSLLEAKRKGTRPWSAIKKELGLR
jgi:prevent-host-death family protein